MKQKILPQPVFIPHHYFFTNYIQDESPKADYYLQQHLFLHDTEKTMAEFLRKNTFNDSLKN